MSNITVVKIFNVQNNTLKLNSHPVDHLNGNIRNQNEKRGHPYAFWAIDLIIHCCILLLRDPTPFPDSQKSPSRGFSEKWWPEAELNCRHADFQSLVGSPEALYFNELPGRPLPNLQHNAGRCRTSSRKIPAVDQVVFLLLGNALSRYASRLLPYSFTLTIIIY